MMNMWVPSWPGWGAGWDPSGLPIYARYDFVEYWEYVPESNWASTPGANKDHPFKKVWRDDFDSFDYGRWKKSQNWSFNDNLVTFMES
jgi:hypothetical protein